MNEIKLKPCPFCGRDATTEITTTTYMIRGETADCIRFSVHCPACRIGMHSSVEVHETFEEAEKAMQRAINYWNRRADNKTVKHGKWLDTRNISYSVRCNVCGGCSSDETFYCPNCGAKMDGGNEKGGKFYEEDTDIIQESI